MNKSVGTPGYQVMLAALLSINFGIVFFDRNASNFLMPFIQPDLHLNNTQVGVLAGALSLTWAIAAFGIGLVSDKTGSRKGLLVLATLAFSVCSFLTGIASTFAMMLGARLLMGVAEGGLVHVDVDEQRAAGWMLDAQAQLLGRLTPGRRGRGLAGVDVAAGLHPDAEPLVEVQDRAAPAHHDARRGDVGRVGVLVARRGQPGELREEALAGGGLTRRPGPVALDQRPQSLRGGPHGRTP